MNKVRDIKAGLEIFERRGGTHCAAEHDIFYAVLRLREGGGRGRALRPRRARTPALLACPNLPRVGDLHVSEETNGANDR